MQEVLDYLYNLERFGIKLGLETTEKILERLCNPERDFKSVHITGTNGKGSTAAFVASILQEAGYKTGLYTSPHLVRFNERVQVGGVEISDSELVSLVEEIRGNISDLQPTFFEFTTALAFLYFSRCKVDFAVVEVGMGGRLDATNVIVPEVAIITNVDLDHMKHLGESKELIAREKAAIIKKGVPLVTAERDVTILDYLKEECKRKGSEIFVVGEKVKITSLSPVVSSSSPLEGQSFRLSGLVLGDFCTKMLGKHQLENAATAVIVSEVLRKKFHFSSEAIKKGVALAFWSGRLEVISQEPLIIVDGAHNAAGMKTAVEFLSGFEARKRKVLVLGMANDKEISKMVGMIAPLFEKVIITQGNYKPAATSVIATEVKKYVSDANVKEIADPAKALREAKRWVREGELIFCTGSLYLVGDLLKLLRNN